MLIDISLYGLWDAVKGAAKVIVYHAVTDLFLVTVALVTELMSKYQVAHPEYALYIMGAIALTNAAFKVAKDWLTSINPEKLAVPVVEQVEAVVG